MKRIMAALFAVMLMLTAGAALADKAPVKMDVPPQSIPTQAEGELET